MSKPEQVTAEWQAFLENVRNFAKTRQGQEILWHILGFCGIYDNTFTGDNMTHYLAGRRSVGLEILQLLEEADPKLYPQLLLAMQGQDDA